MHEQTKQSTSSFQRVARDVLDLFELQMQLISVDSQEAKRKLTRSIICGSVAAVLAGSALTVLMIACGLVLGEFTSLSTGGAMLVICAVVFFVVAVLGWTALKAINAAANAMAETKSEFAENLRWLKATLVAPQSSPRNRFRRDSFNDPTATAGKSPEESHYADHFLDRSTLSPR
ncbi:phage holin family protein [Aporhodopirellula aestuarii]|uniref:Phage holin family protein n=1 Tax=Aporhodopirellula aestuarii TaxID=2950107 RepID=A0ABT0U405_9BACT|nr:phage holin family protein [Aporhodopirellula aestuarii]MCM2371654.1 phage holin family protein [Aporhodopirellula aestuarii]